MHEIRRLVSDFGYCASSVVASVVTLSSAEPYAKKPAQPLVPHPAGASLVAVLFCCDTTA